VVCNYVAIQKDVSAFKLVEKQQQQLKKMESVGDLAGGIAHGINNLLGGIWGNLYLARKHDRNNSDLADKLNNIDTLSRRIADMVNRLLVFARRDLILLQKLSLSSFLNDEYALLKQFVPEKIKLSFDRCNEELLIKGNPTQLEEVLISLVNNACDALNESSEAEISLTLYPFTPTTEFLQKYPALTNETFAHLSIRDNGRGLTSEDLDKAFEPFSLTKKTGAGAGLNMAMAYGSIQAHGGAIELESTPGKGTICHIYLPLLHPEGAHEEGDADE
jgi:signal transduction histidine kinase